MKKNKIRIITIAIIVVIAVITVVLGNNGDKKVIDKKAEVNTEINIEEHSEDHLDCNETEAFEKEELILQNVPKDLSKYVDDMDEFKSKIRKILANEGYISSSKIPIIHNSFSNESQSITIEVPDTVVTMVISWENSDISTMKHYSFTPEY